MHCRRGKAALNYGESGRVSAGVGKRKRSPTFVFVRDQVDPVDASEVRRTLFPILSLDFSRWLDQRVINVPSMAFSGFGYVSAIVGIPPLSTRETFGQVTQDRAAA